MKKILAVFVISLLAQGIFGVQARADDTQSRSYSEEYTVTAIDGVYKLIKFAPYGNQTVFVGDFGSALSFLDGQSGYKLTLDSIVIDSSFSFPKGSYTLDGSLSVTDSAIASIPEGASVSLLGASLSFSEGYGYLRIKGGSLSITDSSVAGSSLGAVKLDYSSASHLLLCSGEISSASAVSAVTVNNGAAVITGGRIYNSVGPSISNDAALHLSAAPVIDGVGFDILTEKPISLEYNGDGYSSDNELRVKYLAEFEKGTMTEIFYSSSEESVENISVCSESGKEYDITTFSECMHTSEKNFSAVYLPFSVRFYDANGEIYEEYKLAGEALEKRKGSERRGYSFLGWFLDEEGKNKYHFNETVDSDMALYSGYSLLPPCFTVSSLERTYTGEEFSLGFSALSHTLDASGGFYTYEWFKDGVSISTSKNPRVRLVSDSGTYSCRLTFHYGADSVSVTAENVSVKINKATVAPPSVPSVYYNGRAQIADILPSNLYSFSASSYTDTGRYNITLSLTDFDNYRWSSTDEKDCDVVFEILRSENKWNEEISVYDIYYGAEIDFLVSSVFGVPKLLFSSAKGGVYTETPPVAVGTYYVKAVVEATDNYTALESEPRAFCVLPESVISLSVNSDSKKKRYFAFERFSPSGLTLSALYDSGRIETVGIDSISFSYQNGDSFRYLDNAVILSYAGVDLVYPVEVSRASYDLSAIDLPDIELVYNGKYRTPVFSLPQITGDDGIPLGYTVVGGGTDAGEYSVTIRFSTDSRNYHTPESMTARLVIAPAAVDAVFSSDSFVYDGLPKLPTAHFTDIFGVKRTLNVTGSAVNAGDGYLAVANLADENYVLLNSTLKYEILKADYDLSGIVWSGESFVYDGTEKRVSLSGLPNGISVVGYTDSRATLAGKYTVTASLLWDTKNYNPPPTLSHSWTIERAAYDLSGIIFSDAEYIYDGKMHYPLVSGDLPVGADGSSPSYTFSSGVTDVNEGKAPVTVTFSTDSKNYYAPSLLTLFVTVKPLGITVEWTNDTFTYDNKPHAPIATSDKATVTVLGAAVNAGSYTATAVSDDDNYTVLNDTFDFTVLRAENGWLIYPSVADIYASGSLSPSAEAIDGEVVFAYYLDPDCTEEIATLGESGVYYAIARVCQTDNYLSLESSPISFEIIPVLPVELIAELTCIDKKAFDTVLPTDLTLALLNNDGSVTPVSSERARVIYENSDTLLKRDTYVIIEYGELMATIPVSVSYAEYDLSGVAWENTLFVYDGVAKSPKLTGLPDGVTVSEYIGAGAVNAGKYTVNAKFKYDSENYLEPEVPDCTLVIEKCIVQPPTFTPVVYNGIPRLPEVASSIYSIKDPLAQINAGKHEISLVLSDPNNYAFPSGESETNLIFEILPVIITVAVADTDVYLFEGVPLAKYKVTGGELVGEDTLKITQHEDDGFLRLVSEDPNYVIEGGVGILHRHNTLSPSATRVILIVSAILIALVLLIIVIVMQRERILAHIAVIRYRWRNRETRLTVQTAESGTNTTSENEITLRLEEEPTVDEEPFDTEREATKAETEECFEQELLPTFDAVLSDAQSVDAERADSLITDALAKDLVKKGREIVYTNGSEKAIINVDTLSKAFYAGDKVDINALKEKKLVSDDTGYIKVLARGTIDKPLTVIANDFSLAAVKMIALTGGEAIKTFTAKRK